MRTGILTALLLIAMITSAWALTGKCIAVLDGDSIDIRLDDYPIVVHVRLYGIDCPEHNQPFADEAAKFTTDAVLHKSVTFKPLKLDSYNRTIAWVSVNGKSLNEALVKAGLAWWFRHFAPHEATLKRLEREARKFKRGLWASPDRIPPWRWRSRHGTTHQNKRKSTR